MVLLLIFLIFAALEKGNLSFAHYYWVLYNRAYFPSIYLVIYLFGMIPIVIRLFVSEIATRHKSKLELVSSLYQKTFYYAAFYTAVCAVTSLFVVLCFSSTKVILSQHQLFLAGTFFVIQTTGWFLIGTLFILGYVFLKNPVFTFLLCVFSVVLSMSFTDRYIEMNARTYLSIHDFMYAFYAVKGSWEVVYLAIYALAALIFAIITYLVIRKYDLLMKLKE